MDWGRFKNIAILCFIIINIILYFLIAEKKAKTFSIGDTEIRRIQKILQNNNIGLYTTLPKEFYPMSMLKLKNQSINENALCVAFFGKSTELNNYIDNEKLLYYNDDIGELYIYKTGKVSYIDKSSKPIIEKFDKNKAKIIADEFVNSIKSLKLNNYYTHIYATEDGYTIEYNSKYKNMLILSNYIKVFVNSNGIKRVEIADFEIEGYANEKREIYSADEVLINLMYELKDKYDPVNKEFHIMDLKLGYYANIDNIEDYLDFNAEPYYRVLINERDVYYINAYTNKIMY